MFNDADVGRILDACLSGSADYAEVFQEEGHSRSVSLLNGRVLKAGTSYSSGTGIRILAGTNSVYVYSNENDAEALIKLATEASCAASGGTCNQVSTGRSQPDRLVRTSEKLVKTDPMLIPKSTVVEKLRAASEYALSVSPMITQAAAGFNCTDRVARVTNTRGVNREDETERIRFSVETVATKDNEKQTGRIAPGTMCGYEFFDNYPLEEKTRECCDTAIRMVNCGYAPSGKMAVVLSNGFGGVIFHEACGHALEATSVGIGSSYFKDMLGKQIASPIVSARDNARIAGGWGSYDTDDEGNQSSDLLLIENGILKNYLVDELGSRRMGMKPTGCSRRQDYTYAPTSRMSNTYICNGTSTPSEIISNTEYGLYCTQLGGGSVDTSTGDFNFAANEAFIIRNGRICEPVRGATLIGKGQEILKNIDMCGNDLEHEAGVCGSVSGGVPVTVGQPTIRVSSILVGGRDSM